MSKDVFQIQTEVEAKEILIQDLFNPGIFTLNPEVEGLMKDIQELQTECTHSFKNGKCIYCHKEEDV